MKCREAKKWILVGRDTRLGVETERALRAHLDSCAECAARSAEHDMLRAWIADLPLAEPSAQFDWRLRLRLSKAEHGIAPPLFEPEPRRLAPRVEFWSAAAAAAAVVLAVGLFALRPQPATPDGRLVVDRTPARPLVGPPVPTAELTAVRDGPSFGPQKPIPDSYFYLFPAPVTPVVLDDTIPAAAPAGR
jgi:anti-sigma factor RsiW